MLYVREGLRINYRIRLTCTSNFTFGKRSHSQNILGPFLLILNCAWSQRRFKATNYSYGLTSVQGPLDTAPSIPS